MDVSRQVGWRPGAYAGFWQRLGGYLIDVLLFAAVLLLLGLLLLVIVGGGAAGRTAQTWLNWLGVVAYFAYDTVLTHRYGATLGKRVAGIEVRRPDGTLPSYGVCVGRYLARILSGAVLFIGFLWTAFDPKKQTWHDKIVDTFVIRRADIVRTAEDAPPPTAGGTAAARDGGGAPPAQREQPGEPYEPGPWTGGGTPSASPSASPSPSLGPGGSRPAGAWRSAQEDEGPSEGAGSGGPVGATMETARWGAPSPQVSRREAPHEREPVAGEPHRHPSTEGEPVEPDAVRPDRAGSEPVERDVVGPDAVEPGRAGSEPVERDGVGPDAADPVRAEQDGVERGAMAAPGAHPEASGGEGAEPETAAPPAGPTAARQDRADPNLVAIDRASLSPDSAGWLRQVADQVDPRLDRVAPDWRSSPQADAARACAFGILLGHLARVHRHMAPDLGKVAEVHPSFSTLLAGSRLSTLEQIAAEPGRATAWLGPLIDVEDRDRIARLLA